MTNTSNRSELEILHFLRERGATRLRSVCLRRNRSTIWSLTKRGSRLNLQRAFAAAPARVLAQFVPIVTAGGHGSEAAKRASRLLSEWPPLLGDLERIQREERRHRSEARGFGVGPCSATPMQRAYLKRLYRYLNHSRFNGRLPASVPIRLSNRMKSRLGQMVPGEVEGRRRVLEIALNIDLMIEGNGKVRLDTLVHEMAHAADWLVDAEVGHGPTWRDWAERVGCEATACCETPIRRRRRGQLVTRVPPLPLGARLLRVA